MGGLIIILMILLVIYRIWKSSSRKRGRKLMNNIPKVDHPMKNVNDTWKDNYREDLDDERWKEKREKILKRDGYKCRWCGRRDHLQVHHKYYNKYPDGSRVKAWDYPDDALIVLCDDCHKKYHSKYKVKSYYRKKGIHYEKV